MNTTNIELFKNACAFSLTCRRMGNSRTGNMEEIETDADKKRLRLKKQLIVSPEYEAIAQFQRDVAKYCKARTMPSFVRKGLQLIKVSAVQEIDLYLKARAAELSEDFVPKFVKGYPEQVKTAASALKGQFDLANYPTIDTLPSLFRFEWDFLAFNVPENLPPEIRKAEQEKIEKKFAEAQEQILSALRLAFRELVNHAVDRLKAVPGEKPKTFQKTMVENINEFLNTFNFRNMMSDEALEGLVMSASRVMKGITTEKLRESESVRENVAAKFQEIKATLDTMIVNKPSRVFDMEDE